jgi:hypothetical protein
MKFKIKLLHIKCHVLEFTKAEAFISHGKAHTLRPRREWTSTNDLHLRVPVGNPTLIGLDLPLTALIGVTGRRRMILTCTQIENNKSKA